MVRHIPPKSSDLAHVDEAAVALRPFVPTRIAKGAWRKVASWLPDGGLLPDEDWVRRHRAITWILVLQSVGLVVFALARSQTLAHSLLEIVVPFAAAVVASRSALSRTLRAVAAAFGLIACSAALVHLSGGTIEAHFHFFIMLAVIALYQEWRAFLLAVAFVALHHGTVGIFDPSAVYNHAAAQANPLPWSLIHAVLVLAESAVLIVGWKFSERAHRSALAAEEKRADDTEALLIQNTKATEALRRRESQLQEAQRIAGVASWEWDIETDEMETSDEALRLYALDVPKQKMSDYAAMIHPEDRHLRDEALRTSFDTLAPYSWSGRIVRATGEIRHVVANGKVITNEVGAPVRVVGTLQDVTGAKTLETQLFQAQKMEAVGQLAGGIAHDFNNLLSVITNYAEFVSEEVGDNPSIQEDVAQILKAGEKAAVLTSQLLTFSRKDHLQPKVVSLDEVVLQTHKLLHRSIEENVNLSLRLNSAPWATLIDPIQVEQIVMNLVLNAKDAMPGGGDIVIETDRVSKAQVEALPHRELSPGEFVRLQITDTGSGMSREVQKRIFDPFYTTKEVGKGTGLGLTTIYGSVTAAGGTVIVSSEVGRGSTFSVYLPRVALRPEAAVEPLESSPEAPCLGACVLVVEDQEPVLKLTARILRARGYEVIALTDPAEALALIEEKDRFDLLLTDVIMPGMSGPDLADRMGIHAIYMSGYTRELIDRQHLTGPARKVLHKPFSSDELLLAVEQALAVVPTP